jgi:Luciferase-like monooxygenase
LGGGVERDGDRGAGRFHQLTDFEFSPLPAQGADIPIWTGGRSEAAYRRAGRMSDGYRASQTGPEQLRPRVPIIRAEAEAAGRPMPILSVRARVKPDQPPGPTYALTGSPDDMLRDVRALADLGVQHLAIVLLGTTPDQVHASAEWFAREIMSVR